jgi:hypothetical protein
MNKKNKNQIFVEINDYDDDVKESDQGKDLLHI